MTWIITKEDCEEAVRKNPDMYIKCDVTEKKIQNAINKKYNAYIELLNKPIIESMIIKIEWRKSRMWGYNPHATIWATPIDHNLGTIYRTGYTVSGCGYSKRDKVIENILNDIAIVNILHYIDNDTKTVWGDGVCIPQYKGGLPWYGLGRNTGDFTNFVSEHYAWGETFDEFHITFKQRE